MGCNKKTIFFDFFSIFFFDFFDFFFEILLHFILKNHLFTYVYTYLICAGGSPEYRGYFFFFRGYPQ